MPPHRALQANALAPAKPPSIRVETIFTNWLPFVALAVVYAATQVAAKLKVCPILYPTCCCTPWLSHITRLHWLGCNGKSQAASGVSRPQLLHHRRAKPLRHSHGRTRRARSWQEAVRVWCCVLSNLTRCTTAAQGDAEDRKKLRAADKERLRQMDVEADIDQRLMEAEEMATMGLTCALLLFLTRSINSRTLDHS